MGNIGCPRIFASQLKMIMQPKARIVLADAQYLIRFAIRELLARYDQFEVIGEAAHEDQLLEMARTQEPDLIIFDYNQPDDFGLSTIERLRKTAPNSRLMVISGDDHKESMFQALEAGVQSFLTKNCDEEEIVDAINASVKGEKFYCTQVIDFLLEKSFAKDSEVTNGPASAPLTDREAQIVQLIAKGFIAKEISSLLNLSVHTIYTHRKNIMRKLELSSTSELVLYAVKTGLVNSE